MNTQDIVIKHTSTTPHLQPTQLLITTPTQDAQPSAEAVLAQLQPSSALAQLDNELRDAVMGTAGTAAGAAALGMVSTWILPTAGQDLVAMAVAGAVAYTSVLNLPLRRADTKKKLQDAASQFVAVRDDWGT